MSLHHDLKIHTTAYELLRVIVALIQNMPRDFKRSIGDKLRDECVNILVLIFNANVAREKEPYLLKVIERVQVVELMLRLARDMQWISTGNYAKAIALSVSVGKQAGGWRKQQAKAPAL